MIATFYHRGYMLTEYGYMHNYLVLCENGVSFYTKEYVFLHNKTRLVLPDDICALDSGYIEWECAQCKLQFWARTRPGGEVLCPVCNNKEICPETVTLSLYEGYE